MKTLLFLLCSMALLISCEGFRERATDPETQQRIIRQIDTNNDGATSRDELSAAMKNPLLWVTIINLLLGGGALLNANRANKSTDELWDATHAPKTGNPVPSVQVVK